MTPVLRQAATRALRRLAALALLAASPTVPLAAPALFVEAAVAPNPVDVGAQAVYTLRFFQAVDFRPLRFRPPHARLAEIRTLDMLPTSGYVERVIDGRRYRVFERHYAVLPFASGALAIAGAAVEGRSAFGKAVELSAPELTLSVAAAPPAESWPTGAQWLPARRVELREEEPLPAGEPSDLKLGEAITRTLRVEAEGVDAAALPEVAAAAPGWRVHADAPVLADRVDGRSTVGVRSQRFHWVATQRGALTLPVIGLDWWDVEARVWRRAALPPRPVAVAGPEAPIAVTREEANPRPAAVDIAVLAFGALVLFIAFARTPLAAHHRRWQARRRVLAACRRNDPTAARQALLSWARLASPDGQVQTTGDLARRHPTLASAIARLDAALYGRTAAPWRGKELEVAFRR